MEKSAKYVQDHSQFSVGALVLGCATKKLKFVKHVAV